MKRTIVLFALLVAISSAGCIFDDIEDPEVAVAVFALVAVGLTAYALGCLFRAATKDNEATIVDKLTELQ